MRPCVLLAVLLSLVVSLSKASSETTKGTSPTPPVTPTPTSNETSKGTSPTPPVTPTPTNNAFSGTNDETPVDITETATPTSIASSGTNDETPVDITETATPTSIASSGTNDETPVDITETATPTSIETTKGTSPTPPVTPTPTSSETTKGTSPTPPVTPTPTSSETTKGTSPTPPVTPTPTNNETTNGTSPTPPETPTPTSNETSNGTSPTPPETPRPTSNAGDFCQNSPCGRRLAKCVSLNSTFTCVCQYGFYYGDRDCHRGTIFPGVITLKDTLSSSVLTVNSMEYEQLLQNLTKFFKDAFKNLTGDYKETVIVDIQLAKEFRNAFPATVTVTNLFVENADVDNAQVAEAIKDAAEGPSSFVSGYKATTYCAAFKCDDSTTVCEESEFPKCKCRDGFTMTEWDERSCSGCSEDCSEKENKYCANEKGIPICKCMANFEDKNGKCVSCPVGYSGVNCSNNSELILIIVGTVFGAIILALVTAISIISIRSKNKQDPEKKSLIRSGYANPNTADERSTTMFPRVQTTSGHTNPGYQPNNPYEAPSSNRGPFPARDYEDLYKISREPEGFRMQRRY